MWGRAGGGAGGPTSPAPTGRLHDGDGLLRAAGIPVAAVLTVPELPTDIRHNSKVDRARLSRWAASVLSGGRMVRP
ncbi:hypothetical protein ACEN85_18950 [Curtobacterium sp. CT11-45]|uniref:hypothetical protein n=1 Tax=Curtobacterium sp. CT11-45 TaxID=3243037 RepID=UPI0039B0CE20